MKKEITHALEFCQDGTVDIEATVCSFEETLTLLVEDTAEQNLQTQQAIDTVFNLAGCNLALAMLVPMALAKLQVPMEQIRTEYKRVEEFVKDNTGEKGSGSLFVCAKGKGGGYNRNVMPAPTPETTPET